MMSLGLSARSNNQLSRQEEKSLKSLLKANLEFCLRPKLYVYSRNQKEAFKKL